MKLQFDFKGIQMWQRFHLSGKEHIIVEQFDLIINFSQQIFMTSAKNSLGLEKRCFYNQMEVGIEGVNFTLGVPHIQVISKLVQSIVDFTRGKQDKAYCDGSTPGESRNAARSLASLSESSSASRGARRNTILT